MKVIQVDNLKKFLWIATSQHFFPALFSGRYPKLVFHFELKRNILYFILETYVPSILLVVLSWVSFWISQSSVPARICIGEKLIEQKNPKSWIIKAPSLLHVHGIHFQKLQTLLSFTNLLFCFAICSTSCRFSWKPCYSLTKKTSLGATGDSEAGEAAESKGKSSVILEIISTYSNTWHAQTELGGFCEV